MWPTLAVISGVILMLAGSLEGINSFGRTDHSPSHFPIWLALLGAGTFAIICGVIKWGIPEKPGNTPPMD